MRKQVYRRPSSNRHPNEFEPHLIKHKSWRLLILVLVGSLLLTACSSNVTTSTKKQSGKSSASLQMWIAGNSTTQPIYQAEINNYEKKHPGVTISLTDLPGPSYTAKLDAALAAGKPPAIYEMFGVGPEMDSLVKEGKLVNLSDLLRNNPSFSNRFVKSSLTAGQVNGEEYGIPYNIYQEAAVLYSKPDFEKAGIAGPPHTWAQLTEDIKRLSAVHVIPIAIAGTESDNWYGWWLENYEVHLAGLGVTDAIERGDLKALDSSPVIASAKAMQALVSSNAFEPGYTSASQANDIPYALLGSNQAAMMLFGVFATGFVQKVAPTFTTNGDMGWFSFPAVNGGSGNQIIDLATVPLLVINKNMPQTDIAASEQFIKDFDYSDAQIRSLAKVGDVGFASSSISVIKSVAPKSQLSYMEFQVNEATEAKQSFVKWGSLLPTSVTSAWDSLLEELFTLKITPQAFAVAASKL